MTSREYERPLLSSDVLCIYRLPGSIKGSLARAGQWSGAAVGLLRDNGPMMYHRFMQTDPAMGPSVGVSDAHLTELSNGSTMGIAAAFIEQLVEDAAIVNDATRLSEGVPTLLGQVTVEVMVPTGPPWRWAVNVNGMEVASVQDDWHVGALRDLARALGERAAQGDAAETGQNKTLHKVG